MKICVYGLWHLGTVTAACLAEAGFEVVGLDPSSEVIKGLRSGKAPLFEPGLDALLEAGNRSGKLSWTTSVQDALQGVDAVWVAFDTPVDENDQADVSWVRRQIEALFDSIATGSLMIVSSQAPVGFCRELEESFQRKRPEAALAVCCSPENLRLGTALEAFQHPDRIVLGTRRPEDRPRLEPLFARLSGTLVWMNTESAEMTKHALNAFLATSAVWANEIGVLCESVGANAKEVERGLKTESRIGAKAYVRAGAPIAGGTLARDLEFLVELGRRTPHPPALLKAVIESNRAHKDWVKRQLKERLKTLTGRTLAVLGLTYKAGTDTLRRSWAVELCRWLHAEGARIQAYDPQVQVLPQELESIMSLMSGSGAAMEKCDGAVLCTDHPSIKAIGASEIARLDRPLVIDPSGILPAAVIESVAALEYVSVGYSVIKGKKT